MFIMVILLLRSSGAKM